MLVFISICLHKKMFWSEVFKTHPGVSFISNIKPNDCMINLGISAFLFYKTYRLGLSHDILHRSSLHPALNQDVATFYFIALLHAYLLYTGFAGLSIHFLHFSSICYIIKLSKDFLDKIFILKGDLQDEEKQHCNCQQRPVSFRR